MKKSPFLIILCIFSAITLLSSCSLLDKNQEIDSNQKVQETATGEIVKEVEKPKTQKEIGQELVQQKINNLKKKLALR